MKRRREDRAQAAAAAEERADEAAERASPVRAWFGHVATRVSEGAGSVWAFSAAILVILAWAVTGPMFGFSDTWQLIANTFTTLVTFLMVFLIQNTQNRDTLALQVKLSELILALGSADNRMAAIDEVSDEELKQANEEVKARAGGKD